MQHILTEPHQSIFVSEQHAISEIENIVNNSNTYGLDKIQTDSLKVALLYLKKDWLTILAKILMQAKLHNCQNCKNIVNDSL